MNYTYDVLFQTYSSMNVLIYLIYQSTTIAMNCLASQLQMKILHQSHHPSKLEIFSGQMKNIEVDTMDVNYKYKACFKIIQITEHGHQ